MSTAVEVFPVTLSNGIPYQDYRSITNPIDIANVHFHASDIKDITSQVIDLNPKDQKVFQLATPIKAQASNLNSGDIQLFHCAIGPLEIRLSYDGSDGIGLIVFLNMSLFPPVQLLDISGSLSEGVEGTLGYSGILSGTVGVKKTDGKTILTYSATVSGKTISGGIPLPF